MYADKNKDVQKYAANNIIYVSLGILTDRKT